MNVLRCFAAIFRWKFELLSSLCRPRCFSQSSWSELKPVSKYVFSPLADHKVSEPKVEQIELRNDAIWKKSRKREKGSA
jgi:hypothetical protein